MAGRLLLLSLFCTLCSGFHDATFTFSLPARHMECFYEHFVIGSKIEVQYQVLKGGELDINFLVMNPEGMYIVIDRKTDGWWPLEIEEAGEYGICLDNSFSKLSSKLVFLSIITQDLVKLEERKLESDVSENTTDQSAAEVMEKLNILDQKLSRIVSTQHYFQGREARHRLTLESNNSRVFWWSLLECVVMVAAGLVQVVVIRSLFRTQRRDGIRT